MFALLAVLVLQARPAQAESLLAAGDLSHALRLAQQLVAQHPRDPAAHMLLGRVHFARRVIGRFPALEEFRAAARLAPNDPEPWYWQMKVGFYLRSDDGDYIARLGLLGLFALTPDYADAWQRFHDIYQGPSIWRQAERALARHGEQQIALERRAELLLALEGPAQAESLLAIVAAHGPATVKTYLLRCEAAFLAGRTSAGYAWHDSALARAAVDSSDALWNEIWLIASPDEVARHAETPDDERWAFYTRFWQQRDPNLLTPENERVPEHYARLAEARRTYRLLHPQRSDYHSVWARAQRAFEVRQEMEALVDSEPEEVPGPSSEAHAVASRVASLDLSVRALQDTALPLAFRAGLGAPGLIFLRHGKPDRQLNCTLDLLRPPVPFPKRPCSSFLDRESWAYFGPDGPLSIGFARGEYFYPISRDQVFSAQVLLHTDRTALPAPLIVHAWSAFFQSAELGLTDAYYKARGDSAAAVLWDATGTPHRAAGAGLLRITTAPGRYDLGLDVDSAGALGRIRLAAAVPRFAPLRLGLSSLALAPFERGARVPDRESALRGMPADLVYIAGVPLAAYVEIYGLAADQDGRSQYRVRYTFEPARSAIAKFLLGAARPVVFEFDRGASGSTAIEQLIIEPDKLPAGRYRVTVAVTDQSQNVKSLSSAIVITIR